MIEINKRAAIALMVVAFLAGVVFSTRGHAAGNAAAGKSVREQLVGEWSLVSRETTLADGKVVVDPALSATPKGVLIYDRAGHVAAQLSRQGRSLDLLANECADIAKIKGTNDTSQTVLGYDAYFGTYTLDEKEGVVTHHLESALFPADVGKDIKRWVSISGDMLTIKFKTTTREGAPVTRTLIWARMK